MDLGEPRRGSVPAARKQTKKINSTRARLEYQLAKGMKDQANAEDRRRKDVAFTEREPVLLNAKYLHLMESYKETVEKVYWSFQGPTADRRSSAQVGSTMQ